MHWSDFLLKDDWDILGSPRGVPGPPVHQLAPLDGNRLQLVATAAASHPNPHPGSGSAVDLERIILGGSSHES